MAKGTQAEGGCGCGQASACGGGARREAPETMEAFLEQESLDGRMRLIRHKIIVMSGKGGVGKSTVAANLAVSLSLAGRRVGLLDVDIHGPSIPKMLRLDDVRAESAGGAILPVEKAGLKVMSIGFLLQGRDDAVIWRGPMKAGVIKQFLTDVAWGELDYLVIDSPPGTGDEPLSVCQNLKDAEGAVIVTTPQDVATADVRKSIDFCRKIGMPVLGVVENMSGFACPSCGRVSEIFKTGGGERMSAEMGVAFLGRVPIDPAVAASCDDGEPFVYHHSESETAKAFARVIAPILALSARPTAVPAADGKPEGGNMRIAIPMADGRLCMHFGHCEQFALVDVDPKANAIVGMSLETPPPHEPGLLPRWLKEKGADTVIAGGMGQRAQSLFAESGIKVVVGAPSAPPERLAADYLAGTLQVGGNACDH